MIALRGARDFCYNKLMKQNITVQLEKSVIHDAKILAARRSTSLSQLLANEIRQLAAQESNYERNKQSALARLHKGYALGGAKAPNREELYDR
jgi:hypothetical protein